MKAPGVSKLIPSVKNMNGNGRAVRPSHVDIALAAAQTGAHAKRGALCLTVCGGGTVVQPQERKRLGMIIQDVPFHTIDWDRVEPTEHPGTTGKAFWRTFEMGNIRVRMVEYTPGYQADHWCSRGHVLLVLEGELTTELSDGRTFHMTPGMSYQVANDAAPHRSHTEKGAKLFIVD